MHVTQDRGGLHLPEHKRARASDPWGVISFACAMVPFAFVAIQLVFFPNVDTPNAVERAFYWSFPCAGLLAIITGIAGWRGPRHRALAKAAFSIGAFELVGSIVVFIALLRAIGSAE